MAHPLRTRKRAPSPASGMEPAARRQRTLAPKKAKTGASNQDADVVYVGEPLSRLINIVASAQHSVN